ncbi:MAG: carbohydrate ABC transporter permease [Chloroflexota bacterium]|nr:carbohydrate ABC transporter permease [Anaerolineae bacterium]
MTEITRPIEPRRSLSLSQEAIASRRRAQVRRFISGTLRAILLLIVLVVLLFPIVWMALAAFQTHIEIITPEWGFEPTLRNFDKVFSEYNFLRYMGNSFVVAVLSTFFSLVLGLPAAYAIARFHYDWLGVVLLAARIVPGITFLVPWYILFSRAGLNGSYAALVLSHMIVSMPFIVWVMVPFFEGLPLEVEESARIDGASMLGTFIRIALPLAVPAIMTATIMSFIFSWNNFMFSLVLSGDDTRTLPVAIFNFITYASVDWGGLMAAAVLITLPVLIITAFMQRYVVSGLTAGAIKG